MGTTTVFLYYLQFPVAKHTLWYMGSLGILWYTHWSLCHTTLFWRHGNLQCKHTLLYSINSMRHFIQCRTKYDFCTNNWTIKVEYGPIRQCCKLCWTTSPCWFSYPDQHGSETIHNRSGDTKEYPLSSTPTTLITPKGPLNRAIKSRIHTVLSIV